MSQPAPMFEIWTVYADPADYPGKYVVRRWTVRRDGSCVADQDCQVSDSLAVARDCVPKGLHCLGRLPDDDRAIAETWV